MARVCLTFDNGPDAVGTPHILDVLERHDVRSTFFVVGRQLASPAGLALARRIRDAGHQLGHHTFSHETPLGLDVRPDVVQSELERTHALLASVWDGRRLFRPFGRRGAIGPHLLSPDAVAWLEERLYSCVLWTSVPGDFADPVGWVQHGLADCEREDEVLMVLHDTASEAMQRLDEFITVLIDRGHTLVDTFPKRCVVIEDGIVQPGLRQIVSDGKPQS